MAILLAMFGLQGLAESDQALSADEQAKKAKERRVRGLEKFVLALSDQQLVTGLAILVAGFINRCSMSLYDFYIVAALAWFSSTTHLSTLAVLRVYLVDHPRVRDWRVVAMLGVFGLVTVSQVMNYSTQENAVALQCAFSSFSSGNDIDGFRIMSLVVVVVFLAVSYTNRIMRLYSFDPDWSIQEWLVGAVVATFYRGKTTRNLEWIMIATSGGSKAEQGAAYRKLRERQRYIKHTEFLETKAASNSLKKSFRLFQILILTQEIQNAFLGDIMSLLFGVAYGIGSIIISRIDVPTVGISGNQNLMNFGQLVPLFLMALPTLAAGEVYFGN